MLNVAGAAQLGGTLQINFADSYNPAPGQRFTVILAAGGIRGAFSSVITNKGIAISTIQDSNTLTIVVK